VPEVSQAVDPEAASGSAAALPAPQVEPRLAPHRSRLGVLRHHHFRYVWLGALVSNVGGWMEGIGVQWTMTQATSAESWAANHPSAPVMMGYLAAAQLGPTLVLGIPGGLTADRVNRKTLLLLTQFAMMLIAALLALASYWGRATPQVLIGLSLLQGITLAFNTPAWQVLTPRLVPREELTEAIALNGLQFNLARVLGPALAGVLMAAYGPTVLFVINTISFIAVLAGIWNTPDAPAPPHDGSSAGRRTAEALSFVFHRRGPRAVFLAMVIFATLAAPLMRMLPLFAHDVYTTGDPLYRLAASLVSAEGVGEFIFGLLLAVMGAGAVLGAVLVRRLPPWYPKHHFIPLAILMSGLSITLFSSLHSLLLASPVLFLSGVFWLWAFNSSFAAMQLLVPDTMRGRVMAVCNTAIFGAMPIGALLAGGIGDLSASRIGSTQGMQLGVGLMGAVLAIAGLAMLVWRTPEVDGLSPADPAGKRRPSLIRGITASAHRPRTHPPAAPPSSPRSAR
jgi:MFS family permease